MEIENKENKIITIPEEVRKVCGAYGKNNIGYPQISLYFYGDVGTGKTYTAKMIIDYYGGEIKKAVDILRDIRCSNDAYEEIIKINRYVYKRHLVIDDFGSEKTTDFSYSILQEIIDKRLEFNPEGLIITSNLNFKDLNRRFDKRTSSRIIALCRMIEFKGKDRRIYQDAKTEMKITSDVKINSFNKEKYENILEETAKKWR